ncbi:MAG: alpha/beta hydrolase [Alphaproteobacteria bacterium]
MKKLLSIAGLIMACLTGSAHADFVKLSDELTIHYEQSGNGDVAIVFIPGWTMSTEVFEHQLKHFEGSEKFTAIAYDPRGQGQSSKPMEGHTYQQHGRDLAAFMQKLDLQNVILAGWSYGVTEQLAYLNQFGAENLRGMVLIDTGPDIAGESYDEWVWYLRDDSDEYSRWFTEGIIESRQSVITEFGKWMLEDPSPENLAWVEAIALNTPSTVASVLNATGFYLDYSEDLVSLEGQIPLLYVVREDWKSVAEPWIKSNTPSAKSAFFGKHLMFWERPEQFNAVLDDYLAQF